MSVVTVDPVVGTALNNILMADEIMPGSEPSYQLCKDIYLYHPLGAKIVEMPVKMAQSQARIITIEGAPPEVLEAFTNTRKAMRADYYIRGVAYTARIYGVGTLGCGTRKGECGQPLQLRKLSNQEPYFVVFDALNTAGGIVLEQDPNKPNFQKVGDVTVAGVPWHRSRMCVLFNEQPVYISWTSSAYGFSGRSVYQRALLPLKSFIRTMITDDMVTQKAGLIIAMMKKVSSVVNSLMQKAAAIKRFLLKEAATGNVLSIEEGETIQSIDLQNIDKAMITARSNIIKNIATAVPMPAQILEQEQFAEGFGEGTEDTKNIVRFVNEVRDEIQTLYDYTDEVCMNVAWSPEFVASMKGAYKDAYGKMTDDEIFYSWKNKFKAVWPNLLEEPPSEKSKQEKVKVEGLIDVYSALSARADEDNLAQLAEWVSANLNEYTELFPVPLNIDPVGMSEEIMGAMGEDEDDEPAPVASKKPGARGKVRAISGGKK